MQLKNSYINRVRMRKGKKQQIEKMREHQRLKKVGRNKDKQSREEEGRKSTRYQNQNEQN